MDRSTLKCLYFDNDPSDLFQFRKILRMALEMGDFQADVEGVENLEEAKSRIAGAFREVTKQRNERHEPASDDANARRSFDIFFVDWRWGPDDAYTAEDAVREASQYQALAIIGISQSRDASVLRRFKEAGGDDLFVKDEVRDWANAAAKPTAGRRLAFPNELERILEDHSLSLYECSLVNYEPGQSPKLDAEIESVGIARLSILLRRLTLLDALRNPEANDRLRGQGQIGCRCH
jgi:CheY-like chemotaxis protein